MGERRDTGPDPSRAEGEVAEAARRLDQATAQVETLTRFLEECRRHASRVALFVERRGRFEVWKSVGLPPDARPALVEANGLLDRVRLGAPIRLAAGNAVSAALGAADAREAILVPFVVREKISGAVYADVAGDDVRLDGDAVALLTWIAGLVVDRLARRKLVPSPALRPFSGAEQIAPSDPSPPSFASTPAPDAPAAPLPRAEPSPPTPVAALPLDEPGFSGRSLAGPLAPPAESERRDEARRFARLLASEIKLYNEDEVAEGRARGDLAVRLKDSIERGRRLYEERVPADVRSSRDYYFEELVEVLAGGRPEALG